MAESSGSMQLQYVVHFKIASKSDSDVLPYLEIPITP